jgi:hypothetical protein
VKGQLQRGDVAIADEQGGVLTGEGPSDAIEEAKGAVAASDAKDGADVGAPKGAVKGGGAICVWGC